MKKLIPVTVLLTIIFISGCASTSDYNRLRLEFEQLKRETELNNSSVQSDMEMFKQAYNPELQKTFSDNVTGAQEYLKTVEDIKNSIQITSDKINDLLTKSQNDRMMIAENLKDSEAQNVVNEFRHLNRQWDATLYELSNMVKESEKAVNASGRAAMHASEKAASAQTSADYAVESMNRIYNETKSLGEIQERMKTLEFKVRKINRQLEKNESPETKDHKEKSIQNKIEELEKLLNELKSEIRKDNKKNPPHNRKTAG